MDAELMVNEQWPRVDATGFEEKDYLKYTEQPQF